MLTVLILKLATVGITLIATLYCGRQFAETVFKRRDMLRSGITTSRTRISLMRSVRMEGIVALALLSLLCLSVVSARMPIQPVWNAIGAAQRQYWIAAVADRFFVASLFIYLTFKDKRDRDALVQQDRLRAELGKK